MPSRASIEGTAISAMTRDEAVAAAWAKAQAETEEARRRKFEGKRLTRGPDLNGELGLSGPSQGSPHTLQGDYRWVARAASRMKHDIVSLLPRTTKCK
jgi:hypothetical protein